MLPCVAIFIHSFSFFAMTRILSVSAPQYLVFSPGETKTISVIVMAEDASAVCAGDDGYLGGLGSFSGSFTQPQHFFSSSAGVQTAALTIQITAPNTASEVCSPVAWVHARYPASGFVYPGTHIFNGATFIVQGAGGQV